MHLEGKKLLIIGGAFQHCKLVEAAKSMGVITYVVDYLPVEKSPAKQIADYHFEYNITDYDEIIEMCRKEKIDGALSAYLDACQIPYQVLCERLEFPCFGTKEQFDILTNKISFINACKKFGVDVIPQYTESDFYRYDSSIEYPVFVKPCDSRGSRGQSICYSYDEMKTAIEFAKSESKTKSVVIEKYMSGVQDFSMSYLVVDGEVHLTRTGDRYLGAKEDKMDKSAILGMSPSDADSVFKSAANKKVANMLKGIGLKNAPVFMQGFIDGDKFRFYDPGLRFPGIEYDRLYTKATGINVSKALVLFALTGHIPPEYKSVDSVLNGKCISNLFIPIRPGKISKIYGIKEIEARDEVICFVRKYKEGDVVGEFFNVNQRFCEIDILSKNREELKTIIDWIYKTLVIISTDGIDMKMSLFNTNLL